MTSIKRNAFVLSLFITTLFTAFYIAKSHACTRVLHTWPQAVMVGRNMDWFEDMNTQLRIYPRGIERTGKANQGPSIKWVSKYGSMVVGSYKNITAEGMNEQGLSVHLLTFSDAEYGERQINTPGLSVSMWAQYHLDQFASVAEAVEAAKSPEYQLELFYLGDSHKKIKLHLAMEDAEGNSAVIEYLQGEPMIYLDHGKSVLANSPAYNSQLKNLKEYIGFGGDKPLPGSDKSKDRFVRASWYNNHLPNAQSIEDAAFSLLSIIRNAAQPYTQATNSLHIERTLWQVVGDLTHRHYFYASTTSLNIVKISLDHFDLSPGASSWMLEIDKHPELTGDISNQFKPFDEDKS